MNRYLSASSVSQKGDFLWAGQVSISSRAPPDLSPPVHSGWELTRWRPRHLGIISSPMDVCKEILTSRLSSVIRMRTHVPSKYQRRALRSSSLQRSRSVG